jgi:hypothetical protein
MPFSRLRFRTANRQHPELNISLRIAPSDWSPDHARGFPRLRAEALAADAARFSLNCHLLY